MGHTSLRHYKAQSGQATSEIHELWSRYCAWIPFFSHSWFSYRRL